MRLHTLEIEGFRRIKRATILFGETTFLIGENNSGKSTVLQALHYLLSGPSKLDDTQFYAETDANGVTCTVATEVIFCGEFRNLPAEATTWRGFKGRIRTYEVEEGSEESGLSVVYRKRYEPNAKPVVELRTRVREKKPAYSECRTPQDLIDAGATEADVRDLFHDLERNLGARDTPALEALDEIWDLLDEEEWFANPGGIPGNVLLRLPKVLIIPAEYRSEEISNEKKGALADTLQTLFEDVRDASDNYQQAQVFLDELARELDPSDTESEFGQMMAELNGVLGQVFPETQINVKANLSDPDKVLQPQFDIKMKSNVETPIALQGTGMVRSAVFGLLQFREKWLSERAGGDPQSLIIGFEEPEMYLHPSAANKMRDAIYSISSQATQIVATTHSPFLIDLSRERRQLLNRCHPGDTGVEVVSFNVSRAFKDLADDDRDYVKMILKVDDHVARGFFTKTVVVVEGDSEIVAVRQALSRLPEEARLRILADFEVISARGKASIISFVRYLKALDIRFRVLHDRDGGTPGAEKFNDPIQEAAGDTARVTVLEECLEDVLGYAAPSHDKPYHAFKNSLEWGQTWQGVPANWRRALEAVFEGYIPLEDNDLEEQPAAPPPA